MSLSGQHVLVTGGAGFIGSHIVERLVHAGARVRVFDDFSTGYESNLAAVIDDIEIIRGTILDADAIAAATHGSDIVVHQAAQLEIMRAIDDPVEDLRTNTEGTLRVFEAAKAADVGHVFYASSAAVYGQAVELPQPESHPTLPNWPYGISKLATEHYARLYCDYYDMASTGYRYSIVYGPREWYGRVLTIFLRRALDGQAPVVFGAGEQRRDYVYVEDVADCVVRSIDARLDGARVLNVSSGCSHTIRDVATLVSELSGVGAPVTEEVAEGEYSELVGGRMRLPAELKALEQDNTLARTLYDWAPSTDLRTGIRTELAWLATHAERWVELHY